MDSTTPKASFSNANRHMQEEEELRLTSVGVDIGSSTSHLVFSRLQLTLEGSRYRVTKREILNESEILLTPYVDNSRIDVEALEAFINQQYKNAKIRREEVDTGALILTGVAVRRRNARAIGELFAQEAGKFVAVSAGDGLEATMAAHGSGAVAHSAKTGGVVLNIDVGGGTSKFALCNNGKVQEVSAIDIGARLLALDKDGALGCQTLHHMLVVYDLLTDIDRRPVGFQGQFDNIDGSDNPRTESARFEQVNNLFIGCNVLIWHGHGLDGTNPQL